MLFGAGTVAMVWDDSGEVKGQCRGGTLRDLLRGGVEDIGWKVRDATIAGERVGGEYQSETLAVETHVPVSVPWKMDGTQAVPNVDEVAVVEPAVGNERTIAKNWPANALQATR